MTRWLLVLATGCWTSSTPATPADPPHRTFHDQKPLTRPPAPSTTQVDLPNRLNTEGADAFNRGAFAEASRKFREAVARVPEAFYFFNLCLALYNEGKFAEGLTACHAGRNNAPSPDLDAKLAEQIDQILDEAAREHIQVQP